MEVTATNWQHSSDASREVSFTIRDDRSIEGGSGEWAGIDGPENIEESSGVGILAALVSALVLAGVVSMRWSR